MKVIDIIFNKFIRPTGHCRSCRPYFLCSYSSYMFTHSSGSRGGPPLIHFLFPTTGTLCTALFECPPSSPASIQLSCELASSGRWRFHSATANLLRSSLPAAIVSFRRLLHRLAWVVLAPSGRARCGRSRPSCGSRMCASSIVPTVILPTTLFQRVGFRFITGKKRPIAGAFSNRWLWN